MFLCELEISSLGRICQQKIVTETWTRHGWQWHTLNTGATAPTEESAIVVNDGVNVTVVPSGLRGDPVRGDVPSVAVVIGAGPAGLMAADELRAAGHQVHVYDQMATAGRKFLLAGRGGLNLTHSEGEASFMARFSAGGTALAPMLAQFGGQEVRAWASSLGIETFVGTSGRIFPVGMKAAPLLRAWLHRLRDSNLGPAVVFHARHAWRGWDDDGALAFDAPSGKVSVCPGVTVLALGGGSWSRLGSDGAWVSHLQGQGVQVAPLEPSNCGFDALGGWSQVFRDKYAGVPLKTIGLTLRSVLPEGDAHAVADEAAAAPVCFERRGECVVTATGLEGSLIYAASSPLRDEIRRVGQVVVELDLLPDWSAERVRLAVSTPRGSRSLSSHLKSKLGLDGVKLGLLYEKLTKADMHQPAVLASAIKSLQVVLGATRPIDEAISTAGGVRFEAMTPELMLSGKPGVFCAGEMLDWDAPTGGYLLTACLSSGRWAGLSAARYLSREGAAPGLPEEQGAAS